MPHLQEIRLDQSPTQAVFLSAFGTEMSHGIALALSLRKATAIDPVGRGFPSLFNPAPAQSAC